MKQEIKGNVRKASVNTSKVTNNSPLHKLKQQKISTPIRTTAKVPLSAKVNTTWNNVLNKNKVLPAIKIFSRTPSSQKCENECQMNEPVKILRLFITELKTKLDILLPGNRAVRNIMEKILKTFSKIDQPFGIKSSINDVRPITHQTIKQRLSESSMKMVDELTQKNTKLDASLKKYVEENQKLKNELDLKESELLNLKNKLNSSKKSKEKVEGVLNESVNTERETIANYEQLCKRLQNEIKTLQDSASLKKNPNAFSVNSNSNKTCQQDMNFKDKFKSQKELALKAIEKEKLLTLLKYHEIQFNSAHCEFCNIYELIQKCSSADHDEQIPSIHTYLDKKKKI